jgi:perosamine synthetase
VLAVDLYGHPADYRALNEVCGRHGLLLVADAAESYGARLDGEPVGRLAKMSTFSFFGNKVLTAGEGGCVTTSDDGLAERMRRLRNHAADPHQRYRFTEVGFNYRMTNVAAAILCAQLERSEPMLARRSRIVARYEEAFADIRVLSAQPTASGVVRAPWMASFLVGGPADVGLRDRLSARLDALGVETRPFFTPIPASRRCRRIKGRPNWTIRSRPTSVGAGSTYPRTPI